MSPTYYLVEAKFLNSDCPIVEEIQNAPTWEEARSLAYTFLGDNGVMAVNPEVVEQVITRFRENA